MLLPFKCNFGRHLSASHVWFPEGTVPWIHGVSGRLPGKTSTKFQTILNRSSRNRATDEIGEQIVKYEKCKQTPVYPVSTSPLASHLARNCLSVNIANWVLDALHRKTNWLLSTHNLPRRKHVSGSATNLVGRENQNTFFDHEAESKQKTLNN